MGVLKWLGLGLWMLAACAYGAVPELPRFGVVDSADGLPSTDITGIAQDRDGYLWLATGDGLARYDGTGFTVWRHDPDNPRSLPGNALQALYIDAEDRIWIGTEGRGVSMLDTARQGFRHYRVDASSRPVEEGVFALAGRGSEVWFGTQGGQLYRIAADGELTHFDLSHQLPAPSLHVMALASDPAGDLWIGTTAGLLRYDGKKLQREAMPVEDGVFALAWIDERLWVATGAGVMQRDVRGHWQRPDWGRGFNSQASNILWAMAAGGDGQYWLGGEQGLWRVDDRGQPVRVAMGDSGVPERRVVQAVFRSHEGGLWVPALGRGLAYLRADWKRTAVMALPRDLGDGVYCPLAPARQGGLWQVAAEGRLSRLDTQTGQQYPLPWRNERLRGVQMTTGLEDHRGRLWLGSYQTGLARIDLRSGAYQEWPAGVANGVPLYGAPEWMIEDARGDLWLSVVNTVQHRDGRSGAVLDEIVGDAGGTLDSSSIEQLGLGPAGQVWLAGNRGMHEWNPDQRRFNPLPGLPREAVDAFALDAQGGLWTYRLARLEYWRRAETGWQRRVGYGAHDGLPATEVMGLQVDESGRLWLSTRRGLWRFDPHATPEHAPVRQLGLRDGLASREFIDECLRMDRGGVLLGGTVDGTMLLVDTRMPDALPALPRLRIEEVSVLRDGRRQALTPPAGLQLQAGDRQLRVSTRLLSFGEPQGNRYRSRLMGLDEDWIEQGQLGQREFSALSAGDYALQVQGVDSRGNTSTVRSLHFSVSPPWWRSRGGVAALVVAGALAILASFGLYRRRLRARHVWQLAQHKRELAEQASLAKTRFLATLGHEVRTPMTGVLGMTELLLQTPLNERQHGYASAIDAAGRHLLRLVNDALDLARIEAGKLSLEQRDFDLRSLLDQVVALARPLAERKGLVFQWQLAPGLPAALRGDPNRVQQILLNLLSNAIKFTERGEVVLHAMPGSDARGVVFEISDTGPGLSQEQLARLFRRFEQAEGAHTQARHGGSGLGLAICRELATAMGGTIEVDSLPGRGARFRVELPLPWLKHANALVVAQDGPPLPVLRLLLVEDDATVAEVIASLLRARDHQVVHVSNGLAALTELSVQHFDVGLFDLDLPGLDGLALVRQLRAMGDALPVIAVTARSDADAQPFALAAGCDAFLRKPVTGQALTQALAGVWRGRAAALEQAEAVD
ncbi:MAG TPA: ATP-binding protein [Stenotrophomonas sp.]|jgi:ligand-binding sensor domain-containing protein/nitrogen-specific signal transduction histidine kinase/ActR/RegA family two-component response regulator